ncbi:MAG: hypothetical protein WCJ31_15120 [Planctomycetia bacterium]|jgi:hypothetical protein
MGSFTATAQAVFGYVSAAPQLAGVPKVLSFDEEFDLSAGQPSLVVVSPRAVRPTVLARAATSREMDVLIYVAVRVSTLAETLAASDLVEALLDRIEGSGWRAVAPTGVALVSAAVEFGNEATIREMGVFRAEIVATYKVAKGQL